MDTLIKANDPSLQSFIAVDADHHFPIQNLPFGVFTTDQLSQPSIGVAIGDWVLDLNQLAKAGFFNSGIVAQSQALQQTNLNDLMSLGPRALNQVRQTISDLLREDESTLRDDKTLRAQVLLPMKLVKLLLPIQATSYTDFYSSKQHATNIGTMFRDKDNPLLPNWVHVPVAYDGRASTLCVSGTAFHRPYGQSKANESTHPHYGASQAMDVEVEMAFFVGCGNSMGDQITIEAAADHIFGFSLLNDWSARDIQKWEYVPLGPFLGKNFCTSLSPWVVTLEALLPFRTKGPQQSPQPLSYLQQQQDWHFDIQLALAIQTQKMSQPQTIAKMNYKDLYWSCCQQLAHHTVNGCRMQSGDVIASGTISGDETDSYGSLIELTWGGKKPLQLASGETRTFLQDNDTVIMSGYCQGDGYRVGFGEVTGQLLAAKYR